MSEILLASTEDSQPTVLPETEEEKARQVPDPVTYHLLCVLPKSEDKYESGIAKAGQTMHFEEVDIAIAAFSTIVFERLYFGYKILIGNEAMRNFPMTGSPLNNICFSDYNDFRQKIFAAHTVSNLAFFEKNNLQTYLWFNFLKDL